MLRQALRPTSTPLSRSVLSCRRGYTTPADSGAGTKVPIKLIAELRKQTHVSVSKAREALSHSGGSIPQALQWLEKDLESTGVAKAAKVSGRATKQGLIAHSVLGYGAGLSEVGGVRASVVELNCETDFVAQNKLFAELATDVAHTTAYLSEAEDASSDGNRPLFNRLSTEKILELPIIQHPLSTEQKFQAGTTVSSAIHTTIVKVGENISLRRARAIIENDAPLSPPPTASSALRLGSYLHGAKHGLPAAPLGALALFRLRSANLGPLLREEKFRTDLVALERALAQQIVGMNTLSVLPKPELENSEDALYNQQFFTLPAIQGMTVQEALKAWSVQKGLIRDEQDEGGIEVLDFVKWAVDGPEE